MQEKTNLQEIERAIRHRNVVLAELEQLAEESGQLQARRTEAEAGEMQAADLRSASAAEAEGIAEELNAARAEAEAEAGLLNEKRTLAATSNERRKSVQYALRRLENERSDLENRLGMQNLEGTEATEKIRRIRESISTIAGKMALSTEEIAREQAELEEAMNGLQAAREVADASSSELAELNRRAAEAINARSLIEVQQTEALTELRNLNGKMRSGAVAASCRDRRRAGSARRISTWRPPANWPRNSGSGWKALRAINMLAVEELTEAEERLDFRTGQRQDIIDSIASAEEALREIKVRSRARFKEAFEAINRNFTQFFMELFGGGRGEMTLLEADDILEAGIEVVAQPPGKRLQNILLLSGGEKAMTAISLVLAIFKYRPSPFCLLDEVDAPLDDANVGRFVTKIEEMSEKTQFIVITHNKRTMEAATLGPLRRNDAGTGCFKDRVGKVRLIFDPRQVVRGPVNPGAISHIQAHCKAFPITMSRMITVALVVIAAFGAGFVATAAGQPRRPVTVKKDAKAAGNEYTAPAPTPTPGKRNERPAGDIANGKTVLRPSVPRRLYPLIVMSSRSPSF